MTGMKRSLLFVLLLLLCLPQGAYADGRSAVSCLPSEADENGLYTVSVELTDCAGLTMIQFSLRYDPEKMECVSASDGALLAGNTEATINTDMPGRIIFVWDSLEPLEANGELLHLELRLLTEDAAELSFDMAEDFIFARDDFSELELFTDGCMLGEAPSEETGGEAMTEEDGTAESPAAGISWPVIAAAAAAVAVLAVIAVLVLRKKSHGKH